MESKDAEEQKDDSKEESQSSIWEGMKEDALLGHTQPDTSSPEEDEEKS